MSIYTDLLKQFISFQSISTDPQFASHIEATVSWLSQTFQGYDFQVERLEGYGNPIVLASIQISPTAETCLIYGHYDVQPAEKADGWNSEPFQVHEDSQRIYARGVVDNKGQLLVHLATVFQLLKEKNLAYNIKFLIEGNEETGSPLMEKCIRENKEKLSCNFVVISDGEISGNTPVIELGFRGGANGTLSLQTANNDLHSGIYGGIAPNSAHELMKLLSSLFDRQNKITIPGFYDDVDPITEAAPFFNETEYKNITGAETIVTEKDISPSLATGLRPTIQITGVNSGYTGEGYRNSIPAIANAKINFRLVKSQNPTKILHLFEKFLKENIPDYVRYTFTSSDPYEGIKLDINNQYVKKAEALLEEAYTKKPIHKYSGGGLPIVTIFHNILKVPQVLVPLGNEDCNMHGANENYDKKILEKSLKFSKLFFEQK